MIYLRWGGGSLTSQQRSVLLQGPGEDLRGGGKVGEGGVGWGGGEGQGEVHFFGL